MKCEKKSSYTDCGTPTKEGGMFCNILEKRVDKEEECVFTLSVGSDKGEKENEEKNIYR